MNATEIDRSRLEANLSREAILGRQSNRSLIDGDEDLATLRKRLMRQARLLVADRDTAEDLVQETLIAVFSGRSSCRGEASLATWSTAILRNKAADWHRSPARRMLTGRIETDDEAAGEPAGAGGGWSDEATSSRSGFVPPDRALEQRELGLAIDECLGRLPARSRQVFTMRERLGFETDEVCERLGITQDHCRMLLHRARAAMRGQLLEMRLAP